MDFIIDTWACETCNYKQDFEPTAELMALHYPFVPNTLCPACYIGRNGGSGKLQSLLLPVTVPEHKIVITTATDTEIEATEKPTVDENGIPVKVNGADTYEKLSEQEILELKNKRDLDVQYLQSAPNVTQL